MDVNKIKNKNNNSAICQDCGYYPSDCSMGNKLYCEYKIKRRVVKDADKNRISGTDQAG